MTLHKIKRPGGTFSYDIQFLLEDKYGVWLHAPVGARWKAPHGEGVLPFAVLLLLHPDRYWVAWWVGDSADRRLEIDICLRPEPVHDGWAFVDLELDPVRHQDVFFSAEGRRYAGPARTQSGNLPFASMLAAWVQLS